MRVTEVKQSGATFVVTFITSLMSRVAVEAAASDDWQGVQSMSTASATALLMTPLTMDLFGDMLQPEDNDGVFQGLAFAVCDIVWSRDGTEQNNIDAVQLCFKALIHDETPADTKRHLELLQDYSFCSLSLSDSNRIELLAEQPDRTDVGKLVGHYKLCRFGLDRISVVEGFIESAVAS
jgi:hypothetical protein